MGDVIDLNNAADPSRDRVQTLFWAYRSAHEKAQRTQDIADGIAAGRAWAAFLKFFVANRK